MRELERETALPALARLRCAVVGAGRLGHAVAAGLREAGIAVDGPLGRGARCPDADVVILAVPDAEIANAAAAVERGRPGSGRGPLVGHCSGATTLAPLAPHEAFSLHPLMTVPADGADGAGGAGCLAGAGAAVAGTTELARELACQLALRLGLTPFHVDDEDRAAYHAAASVASNFLVTLEAAAERLAESAGIDRAALVPLVRATVENWARRRADGRPPARRDRRAHAGPAPPLRRARGRHASARRPTEGLRMRILRTVKELREHLQRERSAARTIGLVPTMGAFHAGHVSLMERSRAETDVVVVSLFVNPTQFGPGEDLAAYPRDEARDAAIAAEAGVDVLFAPPVEEVYPDAFQTTVRAGALAERLEGAQRPGHFDGVATVVVKLLNMVGPDVAYFGQKDAQQALVVRRVVQDLDIPARIEVCPTVREPDGLAMSSRNAYLADEERKRAVALRRALDAAERAVAAGERDVTAVATAARGAMEPYGVEPEYLALVATDSLQPVEQIDGEILVALAARVGPARLIDNTLVKTNGRA
jgi:pantoate--beta-alanine ligase